MFSRAIRQHARLGAAVLSAPLAAAVTYAHAEKHVYASGEALGRGVRLEYWKAKHENVVVLDLESELIQLGITRVRDRENEGKQFVHDAHSVLRATLDLALTELPNDEEAVVTTPLGHKVEGVVFEDDVKVCGLSVGSDATVQESLMELLKGTLPFDSKIGKVLIKEVKEGDARIVKAQLPDDLDGYDVLLLVPDFNALEKVTKIFHLLRQQGVEEEQITIVTLVTCPEATDKFCRTFGDARLVTASFDARRDKDGQSVPGIGDFEGRYLGLASPPIEMADEDEDDDEDDNNKGSDGDLKSKLTSWWPLK